MKKVFFIIPYPVGVAPSQRFRFEQYLHLLEKYNLEYKISSFWTRKAWSVLYQEGYLWIKVFAFIGGLFRRLSALLIIRKYDYVFIHREANPLGPPLIEYIISKLLNRNTIYDFDDAIWLPNTSKQNKLISKIKFHSKVAQVCKWSSKISSGNTFLEAFAKKYNHNTLIIPTTIDLNYHKPTVSERDKKLSIGWTGTHSTIKYLESIKDILIELQRKYEYEILIISNQDPGWSAEHAQFKFWHKENEIKDLNNIDIGVMPLDNNDWEKGKCGFKALQYMALEKPPVVSNVGVNSQIVDHGTNGFLCNDKEEFKIYLSRLIEDKSLRKRMGVNARKKVEKFYSVESNSKSFLSLFE